MTGKTYAILGGGGSFGIHAASYLLDHANPRKVIGIGRNPLRGWPSRSTSNRREGYEYHARHVTYELDLLLELLDREKPQIIVNFAAQGEGAVSWKHSWRFFETNSMALARLSEELMKRDWLERFIQIGTSEMYGSVNRAVTEDEPIKPSSPYAASKVAFDMYLLSVQKYPEIPDERSCGRPTPIVPGQLLHRVIPKAILCGLDGRQAAAARRRQGGEILYSRARSRPRDPSGRGRRRAAGNVYNVGPAKTRHRSATWSNSCAEAVNVPFEQLCEATGDRLGQDSRYWLDSSAIKRDLGWEPQIGWAEGLAEVVAWERANLDALKRAPRDYTLRG